MKTRDEFKSELEADAAILRKYFPKVYVNDDDDGNFAVTVTDLFGKSHHYLREYKTYPPFGQVCLVWDECDDYESLGISLGNGRFAGDIDELSRNVGSRWDNYQPLGVNIADKIKE